MRPFDNTMLASTRFIEVLEIDPAAASELLELNQANRRLTGSRVQIYARAMIERRWELSSDALVIDKGALRNGQHRLHAVVSSRTTQPFAVMINHDVPFDVVDNGRNRSAAVVLELAFGTEAPYPSVLAAVVKMILRLDGGGMNNLLSDNRLVETFALQHQDIVKSVERLELQRREPTCDMPSSVSLSLAAVEFVAGIYEVASPADLQRFGDEVLFGGVDDPDDPIVVVRRQIHRNLTMPPRRRYTARDIVPILARCLQSKLRGEHPKMFRGDRAETWIQLFGQSRPVRQALSREEPSS